MNGTSNRIAELERRLADAIAGAPDLADTLRGTVGERFVRCGKAGCHCQGGAGHGPVFYLSTQLEGRTRQVSLTPETAEVARRLVGNHARLRATIDEVTSINLELLKVRREEQRGAGARAPRDEVSAGVPPTGGTSDDVTDDERIEAARARLRRWREARRRGNGGTTR